jgi:hypothetical protein
MKSQSRAEHALVAMSYAHQRGIGVRNVTSGRDLMTTSKATPVALSYAAIASPHQYSL